MQTGVSMEIVTYPHPTLRHKSKPVRRVDSELRNIIREMFDLMYEARGVGLAANQVDLPIRLFVINVTSDSEEGEELVFINPVLSKPKGSEEKEEGCLSLPELYGLVVRPATIHVNTYTLDGDEIEVDLDGLMARVVQHEMDHLDGVLFIDRLSATGSIEAKDAMEAFQLEFQGRRERGEIPSDLEIAARLEEIERRYC